MGRGRAGADPALFCRHPRRLLGIVLIPPFLDLRDNSGANVVEGHAALRISRRQPDSDTIHVGRGSTVGRRSFCDAAHSPL